MPRQSQTENVRKICGCVKWKTCAHPWYLDYQRDKVRYRDDSRRQAALWVSAGVL